jgi:integrase
MARSKRSAKLDSRNKRLVLEAGKRHMEPLQGGHYVVYQRPKNGAAGAWLGRWYDPETRKQKQTRLGTADDFSDADGREVLTFAQAQEKARAWFKVCAQEALLVAEGEVLPVGPYTVAQAIHDYFKDGKRRGMKGVERAEWSARAHILPALGDLDVAKLTRHKIEDWLTTMAESPKRKRTKVGATEPALAAAPKTDEEKRARKDTANRVLTILRAALNHALDRRRVQDGSAWRTVKPFRNVASARHRFLSSEEMVRLVNVCPPDFRRLVQAALFTGARYGELCRMKVQDFDATSGTVLVAESKSGKPRRIVLTSEAQAWFKSETAGRAAGELLFTRTGVERRKRSEVGGAWGKSDQSRFMAQACKAAKLDKLSFHELRHSYASILVNGRVPMAFVAAQLGHSDTRMVDKHYGHLAPNAVTEAIRTLVPDLGLAEKSKVENLRIAKSGA